MKSKSVLLLLLIPFSVFSQTAFEAYNIGQDSSTDRLPQESLIPNRIYALDYVPKCFQSSNDNVLTKEFGWGLVKNPFAERGSILYCSTRLNDRDSNENGYVANLDTCLTFYYRNIDINADIIKLEFDYYANLKNDDYLTLESKIDDRLTNWQMISGDGSSKSIFAQRTEFKQSKSFGLQHAEISLSAISNGLSAIKGKNILNDPCQAVLFLRLRFHSGKSGSGKGNQFGAYISNLAVTVESTNSSPIPAMLSLGKIAEKDIEIAYGISPPLSSGVIAEIRTAKSVVFKSFTTSEKLIRISKDLVPEGSGICLSSFLLDESGKLLYVSKKSKILPIDYYRATSEAKKETSIPSIVKSSITVRGNPRRDGIYTDLSYPIKGNLIWQTKKNNGVSLCFIDNTLYTLNSSSLMSYSAGNYQKLGEMDLGEYCTRIAANGSLLVVCTSQGSVYIVDKDLKAKKKVEFSAEKIGIDVEPTFNGDLCYVFDKAGNYMAFNIRTAKSLWRRKLPAGVYSNPVLDKALFVRCCDGNIHSLDPISGDINWTFSTNAYLGLEKTSSSPGKSTEKPKILPFSFAGIVAKDECLLFSAGTHFISLDQSKGSIEWESDNLKLMPASVTNPVGFAVKDHIAFFSKATGVFSFDLVSKQVSEVCVLNSSDSSGRLIGNIFLSGPPTIGGDVLYCHASDGNVYAISLSKKSIIWKQPLAPIPSRQSFTETIIYKGRLYIMSSESSLTILE